MSIDKLESETCDGVHHLSDHELEVVTGGADSKNLVLFEGSYWIRQTYNEISEQIETCGGLCGK
jgi:hypothetical protein